MGIEDRPRENLRRSASTATGADVCPRTCGRRSSTASPTRNEASSFRSRPWRSRDRLRGHAPVARHRVHWRSRPVSRESDRALRRGKAVPALWSADAALAVLWSLALT
jgi:hypothetical protein